MKGARLWENIPTIVVKGVCDYTDSHKNKGWQYYAAVTAAACTKGILKIWRPTKRPTTDGHHHSAPPLLSMHQVFTGNFIAGKSIHNGGTYTASSMNFWHCACMGWHTQKLHYPWAARPYEVRAWTSIHCNDNWQLCISVQYYKLTNVTILESSQSATSMGPPNIIRFWLQLQPSSNGWNTIKLSNVPYGPSSGPEWHAPNFSKILIMRNGPTWRKESFASYEQFIIWAI